MEKIENASFIEKIIRNDISRGKYSGAAHTRFPPEPNGFLHIGHAKSICLNFGLAKKYNAACNLRLDDTNPLKESVEYINAIIDDVRWLGFEWANLCYASDYFEQLYQYALVLIKKGKAYVCSLTAEEIRSTRGTLTEPGTNSPDRERSIQDNLDLFTRMRAGEFSEGKYVLRARINMASPNINMRDPVIYRILHAAHHRTDSKWCIYPTYDFTQCLSDAIEKITHSLCTLEFEDHRPLYDWFLDELNTWRPQQIEFARLQLEYSLTSKRRLKSLIDQNIVDGWDDPRLLTISGMRKRGIPAAAIRSFCEYIGVTKKDSWIEMDVLENCIRDCLDKEAPRTMAVLRPLKLVIENYPAGKIETFSVPLHPKRPELGNRNIVFSRKIYIDHHDFMETGQKKFFRLTPHQEVKLRYAYRIRCTDIIKDKDGEILELRCTYDPQSREQKRKTKGIIHWLSEHDAVSSTVHLYERLFTVANPALYEDLNEIINPAALTTVRNCLVPAMTTGVAAGTTYQFERLGYFCKATAEKPLFNRVITLRDSSRQNLG